MTDAMIRHLHESANAVLYRALDLPAGDRQQYIAQATAGDQALFDEVRTMLSRIEQLDQFLEDPLELPAEPKPAAPVLPHHGELIRRWRVEYELGRNGADLILLVRDEHGAGAAGTMRLAESATRTGQTSARFERLRARLATLDHPAIPAPVDGGSTPDGRPYFVVGRGAGTPIDRYCAEQHLDLAQRARLFARFCRAVHYMHQHLIVHRDLKPADMLVDDDGALTLLDVGMIGDGWPLDPAYASPDHMAGKPLSAGSDIYSLGAVLYGLLSGRQAHGGGDASSVVRTGAAHAVTAPSLAVRDAVAHGAAPQDDPVLAPTESLVNLLQLHFDAIVMQALAPDPALRHASAHALALELEEAARHIDGPASPVEAPAAGVAGDPGSQPNAAEFARPAEAVPMPQWPAPRHGPGPLATALLAIVMLAIGVVAGALAAPWMHQAGWLPVVAPRPVLAPQKTSMTKISAPAAVKAAENTAPSLADAIALGEQGHTAEALAALRQALSLQQARSAMDDSDDKARSALGVAEIHRAIADVLAGTGDPAGAEMELAASRAIYAARLQTAPGEPSVRARLLDNELARASAQNAQKHGRDTVATLSGLRRIAAGRDARIDLLEAYVQPRGTPAQAYAVAQPALAALRGNSGATARDPLDPAQTRALARAATMTGEIGMRAKQDKSACNHFGEAARLYDSLQGAGRGNAYDQLALQRLASLRQACK